MNAIYFFSEAGFAPMKDAILKSLISGSHGWQDEGQTWVLGVVFPVPGAHPRDIVNYMTQIGITPLPAMWDEDTPIDPKIYSYLGKWISSGDRTRQIAAKMGKVTPIMHPWDY